MSMVNLLNPVTKCQIAEVGGSGQVTCHFNPKEFTLSSSARWGPDPTPGAKQSPTQKFLGTNPREIDMTLLFDNTWLGGLASLGSLLGGSGITGDIAKLFNWTLPTKESAAAKKPTAPALKVTWGTHDALNFKVFLQSVNVTYQEFTAAGDPSRASVKVHFTEIASDPPLTNPTSGGVPGRRVHLMTAGDSLHSVAQREYGKPSLWRGLAAFNGIDDPMRVAIGTSVLIPPREDVENFS